jgi:hypothetical protein
VCIGVLLVFGIFLSGCNTDAGGDGDVWSLLLGKWESSDGRLTYRFENLGPNKAISLSAPGGYQPNLDIRTVAGDTITGIWRGDDKEFRFNFALSNDNQTLTITNYVHGVAMPECNGVLTKQQ